MAIRVTFTVFFDEETDLMERRIDSIAEEAIRNAAIEVRWDYNATGSMFPDLDEVDEDVA